MRQTQRNISEEMHSIFPIETNCAGKFNFRQNARAMLNSFNGIERMMKVGQLTAERGESYLPFGQLNGEGFEQIAIFFVFYSTVIRARTRMC